MTRSKPKKMDNLLEQIKSCICSGRYRDTIHADERKKQRNIIITDIIHVLCTGRHEKSKDRFDETFNSWNYAIRGWTLDGMNLRVIVSFNRERGLLIITAFYLEKRR